MPESSKNIRCLQYRKNDRFEKIGHYKVDDILLQMLISNSNLPVTLLKEKALTQILKDPD